MSTFYFLQILACLSLLSLLGKTPGDSCVYTVWIQVVK